MKEFQCDVSDAMVNGTSIMFYLSTFGSYRKRGEQILRKYMGIDEIVEDENVWYSLPQLLKAMEEFQKQFGLEFVRKMGAAVFGVGKFPPELDSVEKAMAMANMAYYMNHQCEGDMIGGYHWEQGEGKSGVMTCDSPYPCAFDQGVIGSMVTTFAPKGTVVHDDSKPCRHKDGDSCTLIVNW